MKRSVKAGRSASGFRRVASRANLSVGFSIAAVKGWRVSCWPDCCFLWLMNEDKPLFWLLEQCLLYKTRWVGIAVFYSFTLVIYLPVIQCRESCLDWTLCSSIHIVSLSSLFYPHGEPMTHVSPGGVVGCVLHFDGMDRQERMHPLVLWIE